MKRIITLISFGYGFFENDPDPSFANHIEDVRGSLRNPHMVRDHPELLELDGRHLDLQQFVLATPGAPELLDELFQYITEETKGSVRVAIGCKAGRHRSVALIELLAKRLRKAGYTVNIEHIHLKKALANKPLRRK